MTFGYTGGGFTGKLSEAEIEEFEYVPSRRRVNTGMIQAGKVIRQSGNFKITEASPDTAIYKRGFVIGGRTLSSASKDTKGQSFSNGNKKQHSLPGTRDEITAWFEEGIYGAARHQMSGSEEKDSPTGKGKKDSED